MTTTESLRTRIERATTDAPPAVATELRALFDEFRFELERGNVRSAEKDATGNWQVNQWVKEGILLGFRLGLVVDQTAGAFAFFDKDTYPPRTFSADDGVRIVPGGSSIRSGAHLAQGVVCMPPSYVNVGAYVGRGTMIDSHVLVGSCAQIGERVHLSAAVQVGGVLEPIGAVPVIVEDDVFVGGGCGLYEGCVIRSGAVLAPNVVITRSTRLIDLVNETTIMPAANGTLEVPEHAVVVPGSRPASGAYAKSQGISLYAPVIVKYRDASTSASVSLEQALR